MNLIIILAILAVIIVLIILIIWLYNELSSFRCNICGGKIKRTDHKGYRHFRCQECGNEIVIKLPNKK